MKFAKELDDDLVPEWRYKYLNYKEGKKRIKAAKRAFREANKTPKTNPSQTSQIGAHPEDSPESLPFTHYDFNARSKPLSTHRSLHSAKTPQSQGSGLRNRRESVTMFAKSPPVLLGHHDSSSSSEDGSPTPETTPLQMSQRPKPTHYGSFDGASDERPGQMASLELPDPALTKPSSVFHQKTGQLSPIQDMPSPGTTTPAGEPVSPGSQPEPTRRSSFARHLFTRNRNNSGSGRQGTHTFTKTKLRNVFHAHALDTPYEDNVQLEAYEKLDARQQDFFSFLDKELKKVDDFYRMKEDESDKRLTILREQLHELRDRRLDELQKANGETIEGEDGLVTGDIMHIDAVHKAVKDSKDSNGFVVNPFKPFGNMIAGNKRVGRTTKSLAQNTSPQGPQGVRHSEDNQDYVRKKPEAPSFRVAKRRLKLALQEFYRGLELLKSYVLLNRTAFRKINKKYDKAVNARPTMRYYSEKVDTAYFVKSDVIGSHIVAVEDLYARYFEKGNHKVAVNKLRSKLKNGDFASVAFRNGLYVAAGICFAVPAFNNSLNRLSSPISPIDAVRTTYLLQLYGGYFLALLLFLIFCLDCKMWVRNRINYQFIFEYDSRHTLDWRELAELPCFFLFLNGLFFWLNFRQRNEDPVFLYWPVILIGITLVIMLLPFRTLYYQARRWWVYSNWRLFFAGFYPVEFRDFYLGDMYCSLTYTMSQIELFFCLYANGWRNPAQCNSNHSRLMGFFATVPAIWRALQCLRRYKDSGNWFPHLANFAKYMGNIIYYMSLSLYRVNMGGRAKAAFIVFAAINGVYCSFWDVYFDWSLGNFWSSNFLLRDRLGYKRKRLYYLAIPVDVLLRHQWIIYAIFTEDLQHNSAASFFVALAEVLRRGMWSLFRVENEHCNNVGSFRASRDIPLPYMLEQDSDTGSARPSTERERRPPVSATISATGTDLERASTAETATSSVRQRRGALQTPTFRALQRVGTVIAAAHAADFEKKRKPARKEEEEEGTDGQESSDEEGVRDADETDMQEARERVRRGSSTRRS